jgi:hypothetical protein
MPVTLIKRYEFSASKSSYWFCTPTALLGEQVTETFCTIRLLFTGRKLLTSKYFVTISTGKTFTMPRCILVRDATFVYHPIALHATLSVLLLITLNAHNFLITWYKALIPDWLQANLAAKALFVPLFTFVFIFFHSCSKKTTASITSCCEVVVMAISTVEFLSLAGERVIHKRNLTVATLEAFFVPMAVLVRQIL